MSTTEHTAVNYYQILGADPMDQLDRIEDLFRQLAYEAETSGDHSKIPQIVEAFKVLRDPIQRYQYNETIGVSTTDLAPAAPAPSSAPEESLSVQDEKSPSASAPVAESSAEEVTEPSTPAQQTSAPVPTDGAVVTAADPQQPATTTGVHQPAATEPAKAEQSEDAKDDEAEEPVMGLDGPSAEDDVVYCPKTVALRRRELLQRFYKKRRKNARAPGLAIGGLEQLVDYSYETLEFHLWYMLEKDWLLRESSGLLSITYHGVEQHESNLLEGLI